MKKLKIDQILFFNHAFSIDEGFQPYQDEAYLCKETGDLIFTAPKEPSDNYDDVGLVKYDETVAKNPDRYLQIPGRSHGEHHEILMDFLSSIKNSDSFHESEIKYANESYNGAKSIGFWKKQVSEEMYYAYTDFREKVLETEAEKWLRKNGIEVEWK